MRGALFFLLLLLLGSSLAGCFSGSANEPPLRSAGTVYHNARVWTADANLSQASALVVENATILFVGDEAEAFKRFPEAQRVDLGGKRVVPGMIDSHTHFVRVAAAWNCDPANDPMQPMFDVSQMAGIEFEISRAQIGAYHQQTNATGKTPVDDRANVDKAAAKRGLECGTKEAVAMGLTMNVEAGMSSWTYLEALQELEAEGKLPMRQSLHITPPLLEEAKARGIQTGWGSDRVRIAGIKFYSDGWLGPRTSALLAPFSDRPWTRGVLFLEQAEADAWVERARAANLKAATHAIGDHGIAVVLNAYAKANDAAGGAELRFSIEHGSVVEPRFVERLAAEGVTVSYQHSFATSDYKFIESALGPQRAKNAYQWKRLMDAGVTLAGGSDFPIEVLPPLWGLQRVVTRQELDGNPPGGYQPDQRLTVEEALLTITRNAAYNVFMEDRIGSLEPGKLADFVVLDQDILTIDPHEIAKTCVAATYVSGERVYDGSGANSQCGRLKFSGVLPPRDPEVIDRIHAQIAEELFGIHVPH